MGRTLAEKVWDDHVVRRAEGEPDLLFIDLHLLHEVTSPQAFDGLRPSGRPVRRLDLTIATEDHNTPTLDIDKPIADPVSRVQLETLRKNAAEFGVRLHPLGDVEQGVVHVVYYDTRNSPNRTMVDLYYSFSTEVGVTWNPPQRLSSVTSANLTDGRRVAG